MANPEQCDEGVHPEEDHRAHHLEGCQHGERQPAVWPGAHRGAGGHAHPAPLMTLQDPCHQHRRRDEHCRCPDAESDQRGRDQCRGEKEPDAAARGEQTHARATAAGIPPGVATGRRVECGDAETGEQHDQPHRGVDGHETGQSGSYPGHRQPHRREPEHRSTVGEHSDERLRQRRAERGGECEPGGGGVAVSAFEDEERDRRRYQALVEVVDRMRDHPVPHPNPHARWRLVRRRTGHVGDVGCLHDLRR